MTEHLYLTTPELKKGDIVLNSGMRILLDTPANVYKHSDDPTDLVYAWPGLVLNADDLCDKGSEEYDAYIACHIRGTWWKDCVPRPRKDQWTVQGNHLARWHVERGGETEEGDMEYCPNCTTTYKDTPENHPQHQAPCTRCGSGGHSACQH